MLGVGLSQELEETNWREPSGIEPYGIEKRIEQHLRLAEDGRPLGFEVVSYSYGNFGCSWLCNNLHFEMNNLFGIRPKDYGLLDSEQDAKRVYEWIAEDAHRAEPEPYDYWLLLEYPLEISNVDI